MAAAKTEEAGIIVAGMPPAIKKKPEKGSAQLTAKTDSHALLSVLGPKKSTESEKK